MRIATVTLQTEQGQCEIALGVAEGHIYIAEYPSWSTRGIYRRFPKTLDGLKRAIEHLEGGEEQYEAIRDNK